MQFAQDGVSNYPVLDGIDPSFEIDRKQFIGGHNYVTHVNGKPIEELCDTKVEGITQGSLLALLTDGEPMRLEVMVTDEGNSHFEQILVTKRGKSLVYQAQGYPDFPLEIISKTLESRFARIVSLPEDAKQGRIPVRHIITVNDKSADHACWVPKFLEMIENIKVGQHVQVTIDTGNASVPVDLTKSEIVRSMRVQCSRIESGDGL